MHMPIRGQKWTEENLEYLKTAYLQGSPLKQIASKLNRSVSAINKVLARHHLRTQARIEKTSYLRHSIPSLSFKKSKSNHYQRVNSLYPDHRLWVPFAQVLLWLKSQNIFVTKSKSDIYYEVNGYPKNQQQILYIANYQRDEQQLPPFFVRGVTEE